MQSVFLLWLKSWEEQVQTRIDLKASERKKLLLSDETLLGVRMSAYSLIDLVKFLFTIPSVNSFLSERLSQDPLENYFGQQRQRGVNENPTCDEFLKNNQALRVVSSIKVKLTNGNTRGSILDEDRLTSVFTTPSPKRRKTSQITNHANKHYVPQFSIHVGEETTCTSNDQTPINKPDLFSELK
uniref:Transposable element P transposase-like RNase H C-terminal domain-containing protein n=1 Tax=Amphimedon queenslandica TaxID=400682 RepID=A0A1X7TM73_AMPQE